jgi:tRNA threonylcarbamoyladenosine biosynthesis protein TsaE
METLCRGLEAMQAYAANFTQNAAPHKEGAYVVGLQGDLGSGKTTFVQGMAKALGIKDPVTSPTFVIMKTYPLESQKFSRLVHIDAYRLTNSEELEKLGFKDIIRDLENFVVIEWPENVAEALPKDATKLSLRFIDENTRGVDS